LLVHWAHQRLLRPGMRRATSTVRSVGGNANISGSQRSTQKKRSLVSYGPLSTHCSAAAAAASRQTMTSTPFTSINISMAKSSLCDRLPLMPLRRYCRRIPPNSVTFIQSVNADDVVTVIHALSDKSCVLDPPPTAPLKADVDVIAPFLT